MPRDPQETALEVDVRRPHDELWFRDVDLSKTVPFATVKAMVTLGYKYHLDAIRDEGVTRLEICFPEDGEDFHNGVAVVPTHAAPESFHGGRPIELTTEDAISVVILARKFDKPHLLPTAIYTAAQSSITALVEAATNGDLSPEDLILILERRDDYVDTQYVHFWVVWEILAEVKCPKDCISKLWRYVVYECGGRSLLSSRPNALDDSSSKLLRRGAKTLCKKCMQRVLTAITGLTKYNRWDMLVEDVYS